MAVESSKLRLVRCPKCENLLPELPDYSVYQCGGCGAVLRAKKVNSEGGSEAQKSTEEIVGVVSDKSENFLGKSDKILGKGTVSGVENGESRVSNGEGSNGVVENSGNDSKREIGAWDVENGNSSKSEMGNGNLEAKVDKLETAGGNVDGLRRSSRVFERKSSDIGAGERFGRIRRDYFEGVRSSSSNHLGDSSKYNLDSVYRDEASRVTRAELIEHDREELLRKLDELKDQLSRVNNVNDKFHEKPPLEHRMASVEPCVEPVDCFRDHPSSFHQGSRQYSSPNKHVAGPPYFEHYHERFPATHNYHSSLSSSNHVPRYEDAFEAQILRRPPPQRIPSHHQYMGPELDSFESHPYGMAPNHHPCSCYRCYERQLQAPMQIPPPPFANRRFPHVANKSMSCHRELQGAFGSHGYNSRIVDPQPHTRWPSELSVETGSLSRGRPQRVVLPSGHRYRPVAGGAPFVTCHNCFEVLKLPKKVFCKKDEWQISCGACSTIISFTVTDEKLVPVDTSVKQITSEAFDKSNGVGHGNNASFCSEDYANSVYDFQAMDREPVSSSTCRGVSSSKSDEMHNLHSVSVTTSEDEHFSDDLVVKKGVTSTTIPPEKVASSPSPPGSPLKDTFDYTSKYRGINRYGNGNLSSRSDQERIITNKSAVRQNSLKESLATEMEISPNAYRSDVGPQDSADKTREDNNPKIKRGVDSFLSGIIKKSFRDFSKSNQTMESGKRNVTVNGHLIPDKLVKKAEKMAGPIYPGQYWYDYRAGFWGVMGGPCLGIIPPFIEEFNHRIPENCAGGNTGVFVNGRELHQKDLDLLTIRGLPDARDRSYIVEISGRVVDEDSGQELDSLGKLAPTIEKVKHGFGMRVPKTVS
ncbi:hypothetical protein BVRB_1g003470 [Beta vulgaris subsp. vulgaris]|nr:hypothetical protein BVRB_1g003470 [Beta vulgaris subsp. vulgaris]